MVTSYLLDDDMESLMVARGRDTEMATDLAVNTECYVTWTQAGPIQLLMVVSGRTLVTS